MNYEEAVEALTKNAQMIKLVRTSIRTGWGLPPVSVVERGTAFAGTLREKLKEKKPIIQLKDKGTQRQLPNFGIAERLQNFGKFRIFDRLQRQHQQSEPKKPELTAEEKQALVEQARIQEEERKREQEARELERIKGSIAVRHDNT